MLEKVSHQGSSKGCLIEEALELRPENQARRVALASLSRFECCCGVESAERVSVAATWRSPVLTASLFTAGI